MSLIDAPISVLYGNPQPLATPGLFLTDALRYGQISQQEIDDLRGPLIAEYYRAVGHRYPWGIVVEGSATTGAGRPALALHFVPIALWQESRDERSAVGVSITYWLTLLRPVAESALGQLPTGVSLAGTNVSMKRHQHALVTLLLEDLSHERALRRWVEYDFLAAVLPAVIAVLRGRIRKIVHNAQRSHSEDLLGIRQGPLLAATAAA